MTTTVNTKKLVSKKVVILVLLATIMMFAILIPTVAMAGYTPSSPPSGYKYSHFDCEKNNCDLFWAKSQKYYAFKHKVYGDSDVIISHAGFGVCC